MTYELSAAALSSRAVTTALVVADVIALVLLFAVLWSIRRAPRDLRERVAAGRHPGTLTELAQGRPPTDDDPPRSIVGVLTASAGPEVISPVTRRSCAVFRVELDRIIDHDDDLARRQADVCSGAPAILTDSTGSARIDPALIAPGEEWLSDTRRTGRRPDPGELAVPAKKTYDTTAFVQREFVVPAGVTVTVVGRMVLDRDGWLRPAGRDRSLFLTAKTPLELVAAEPDVAAKWLAHRHRVTRFGLVSIAVLNVAVLIGLSG